VSSEARFRLHDRDHAPFGLTIGAEPYWARVDEASGEGVDNYGTEFSISTDTALIDNRLYRALNLLPVPLKTS
jgi:hypothetical protein